MASTGEVYVLAKAGQADGDDAVVTIHGYTNDDTFVTSWENAGEHNVSFTVDLESPASFEPMPPNEQS
jgi:hypothetical protein